MNKFDTGQVIAILANLGVIAGIVFLALELQQNNEYMAANARFDMLQNQVALMDQIATSPELSELVIRATDFEDLSASERLRLSMLTLKTLRNWQWEFEEYRAGRLELEQLPVATWRVMFNGPSAEITDMTGLATGLALPFEQIWNMGIIAGSDPAFAEFIEANVVRR